MLLSIVVGTLGRNEPALLKIMGCVKKIIRLGHDKGLFSRHQFTLGGKICLKSPLEIKVEYDTFEEHLQTIVDGKRAV